MIAVALEDSRLDPFDDEFALKEGGLPFVFRGHDVSIEVLHHLLPNRLVFRHGCGVFVTVQRHAAFLFPMTVAPITILAEERLDILLERQVILRSGNAAPTEQNLRCPDACKVPRDNQNQQNEYTVQHLTNRRVGARICGKFLQLKRSAPSRARLLCQIESLQPVGYALIGPTEGLVCRARAGDQRAFRGRRG